MLRSIGGISNKVGSVMKAYMHEIPVNEPSLLLVRFERLIFDFLIRFMGIGVWQHPIPEQAPLSESKLLSLLAHKEKHPLPKTPLASSMAMILQPKAVNLFRELDKVSGVSNNVISWSMWFNLILL